MSERRANVHRKTKETEVRVSLDIDGSGSYQVRTRASRSLETHVLESFAKHGLFDLELAATGDLAVDIHHTIEDVAIALGQAVRDAFGDATGIRRYGTQLLPMAEAKVEVAVDVSNRAYLVYRVPLDNPRIGSFDASLVEDFLYAFAHDAGLDLHRESFGKSPHHIVKAIFKGLARALRIALERDPRVLGLPTVKGAL